MDAFQETRSKAAHVMFGWKIRRSDDTTAGLHKLQEALNSADAVMIGAGAGLSTSAGFSYSGKRFDQYFRDFAEKYQIQDMYSGGFYPFHTLEEHWAWWSRSIWINRYMDAPKPVYSKLHDLVKDKDYFVLTTNVDHCFQKAGFDRHRLFYTQGDFGLHQCSEPCHRQTYDNEDLVRKMLEAQGFVIGQDGILDLPEGVTLKMEIPSELIPYCPRCHKPMTTNLRIDDTFVEDEGWRRASERYATFLRDHQDLNVLFLELAVGFNTPAIIKYSFWRMVHDWKNATYACLNYGEAYAPDEIKGKSICIGGDIGDILTALGLV